MSIVSAWSPSYHVHNAFQLFGVDLMLDADWKPYCIEVNANASLKFSSKVSENHQRRLVHDMLQGALV